MDRVFDKDEDRHNHGGGVQLLTHGEITRIDITELAFVMVFMKYINKDKWN